MSEKQSDTIEAVCVDAHIFSAMTLVCTYRYDPIFFDS